MLRTLKSRRSARLYAAALLAVAATALSSCANSGGSGSEEGTIVFQPATESMAVLTQLGAFSTDAFKDAGLDVDYNAPIPNAAQAAQSVTTGSDIAIVGSSGVLPGVAAGRDMVTVATLTKGPTTQITLRNDVIERLGLAEDASAEDKIKALKGLKIALPQPGSLTDVVTREAFRLFGIDADKDMTIRPITEPTALVTAVREGQVDGYAFSAPTSVQPVAEGYGSVWVSLNEVPELAELPFIDVVTSKTFLKERRDDVVKFVKVLQESAQVLADDPDSVKESIQKKYFAELEPNLFDLSWEFSLPTAQNGIEPSKVGFDALVTMTENQTGESVDVSFDDVYDLSVLEELGD